MCLRHGCQYTLKVRMMSKNGFINSIFRNAGYAWKVRMVLSTANLGMQDMIGR